MYYRLFKPCPVYRDIRAYRHIVLYDDNSYLRHLVVRPAYGGKAETVASYDASRMYRYAVTYADALSYGHVRVYKAVAAYFCIRADIGTCVYNYPVAYLGIVLDHDKCLYRGAFA